MTDLVPITPEQSFPEVLRQRRLDAGLTQEALAERAAISARTISDIERGLRTGIYRETAKRLADALDLGGSERATFERAARRPRTASPPRSRTDAARRSSATDLPTPLTRLIGRDDELAAIVAALQAKTIRVLTLLGPGGIGKTRLAIEAADQLGERFADGVSFVPLAVTRDPAMVPALMGRAIRLTSVRKPIEEALRDHLRGREMLIVLDSFEHLLSAAAFVAELAVACPRLTLLVTSRAPLGIRGEREMRLVPLVVPPPDVDVAGLERYPATALFLERAWSVKPDLTLDPDSAATIARVCRRLEGLPLALELAAVRVRHMPLAALQAALEHRLDVLVDGPRDLPSRLQTMRDAITWSYELLPPQTQRVFRAVSVFSGGWTLAAAASIGPASAEAFLRATTTLVDNNLVTLDEGGPDEGRFRMLDVIREFAAEQAVAHAEADELGRGHAALFADFAEAAEREQGGPLQEPHYRRLQLEQDNVRTALAWAVARRDARLAQRLAGALWLYWRRHGDYTEARRWLDQALAIAAPDPHPGDAGGDPANPAMSDAACRRKALWGDAWISYYQGDYPHVRQMGEELVRLARRDDDRVGVRNGLTIEALVAMADQRFDDALGPLEESLAICRDACPPWLLATSLLVLGQATLHGTDPARCRTLLREALAIYKRLGDRLFVARTNGYLGYGALLSGDLRTAGRLFAASLREFTRLDERFGIAEELQALATLAAADGRDGRAAILAGAAHGVWASMSAQPLAPDRPIAGRYLDPARHRLGSAAWRASHREGQSMELAEVVRLALG